ncbi:MAG: CapA family protein [Parasphingorhabdus sp.]
MSTSSAANKEDNDQFVISGMIDTSFDGIGFDGISVTVNDKPATIGSDGRYTAEITVAPYYQVKIDGSGIYTAFQTFGINELYNARCACLDVPSIGVVERKLGRVELLFAGDAMAGRRFSNPIWGERSLVDQSNPLPDLLDLLKPMQPYVETADLASVNLEIVLSDSDPSEAAPKSIVFYAPPQLANALAQTGFDHVSLGNNHSYDYLQEGLDTTIRALEIVGLEWSGAGKTEEESLRASRIDVSNQAFSMLGFVGWKGRVEPNQIAERNKGGAAYGSDVNIANSVSREAALRRSTVVQYHGSREYSDNPSSVSERRMKLAVDNGAVLVASHHPHVSQGLELYNGALIAYSTGNFLFDQYFLETHGSYVMKAWMDHGRVTRAEVVPIRILDYRPVPAVGSMRERVLDRIERLSAERSTGVSRNGGHGLILPTSNDSSRAANLSREDIVGHDLLLGGDFENAVYDTAIDRSIKVSGADFRHDFRGKDGHVLSISPHQDARQISLTPSTFFRIVPGNQVTVSGKIRTSEDLILSVANQERAKGVKRFDALETAPIIVTASETIKASKSWHYFKLNYDLMTGDTPLPFRPILQFTRSDGAEFGQETVELDDLRVIVPER